MGRCEEFDSGHGGDDASGRLVCALVKGWQLTLMGFAVASGFVEAMALQRGLAGTRELKNKRQERRLRQGIMRYVGAFSHIFFCDADCQIMTPRLPIQFL